MLNGQQQALWRRIETFRFDEPGTSFTFADRLARDNGWTRPYAARVVEEYRRFLLLAAAGGHPATPSEDVDRAWHLHLTYTRSYWQGLCEGTLGRALHHEPTQGGAAERRKFFAWYEATLAGYRQTFDAEPPSDIWPAAGDRFACRNPARQGPARRNAPGRSPARRAMAPAAVAALLAAAVGWGPAGIDSPWVAIVAAVAGIAALSVAAGILAQRFGPRGPRPRRRSRAAAPAGAQHHASGAGGGEAVYMVPVWGGAGGADTHHGDRDSHEADGDAAPTDAGGDAHGGDAGSGDGGAGGGDGGGSGCGSGCGGGGCGGGCGGG